MSLSAATVVRLTPRGGGAIAVVHVEGPGAVELVQACFSPHNGRAIAKLPAGRIVLGRWGGAEGEELIVCRRAGDRVEIHPHGGPAAVDGVVQSLTWLGAVEREWTDWVDDTEKCPLGAAARIALAEAPTRRTAAILLDQYHGALRKDLDRAIDRLRQGELPRAAEILTGLIRRSDLGRHLTRPWSVVLAGAPNVGKSSLINTLVGYERALVYGEPGTTRDVITARTAIDGWPVELSDTAGLRASSDPLETLGILRAERTLGCADIVVLVLDATSPGLELPFQLERLHHPDQTMIVVINKVDLVDASRRGCLADQWGAPVLFVSAMTREGVGELLQAVSRLLVPDPLVPGAGVPFTQDHWDSIRSALRAVEAGDPATAIRSLMPLYREKDRSVILARESNVLAQSLFSAAAKSAT